MAGLLIVIKRFARIRMPRLGVITALAIQFILASADAEYSLASLARFPKLGVIKSTQ